MNKVWFTNIFRIIFILIIQLILFKGINLSFGSFNYVHFTIYGLALALFPYNTPRTLVILSGFVMGLVVDVFYDSLGVHAAATTFVAYARYYILSVISPTEGYGKVSLTISAYGISWFLTYMSIFLFTHLLFLYSVEAFSFVYIQEIVLRTVFSFIVSLFTITIAMLIFNPKV